LGSILAGKDGKPGFIDYPRYNTVFIEAKLWKGDPFHKMNTLTRGNGPSLIAGIGVEVSTRRRNKFAGYTESANVRDGDLTIVSGAMGTVRSTSFFES